MMDDDPKSIAMLIMKKKKGQEGGKPSMEESDDDMEDGAGAGPEALKDMHKMMRSGDYAGAFDALKMAVSACEGDEY